jgi:hypothetical protein
MQVLANEKFKPLISMYLEEANKQKLVVILNEMLQNTKTKNLLPVI